MSFGKFAHASGALALSALVLAASNGHTQETNYRIENADGAVTPLVFRAIADTSCFEIVGSGGQRSRLIIPDDLPSSACADSLSPQPAPRSADRGASSNRILREANDHYGTPGDTGEVRIVCGRSHHAADDPVVFPGQTGASHMHTFFGNAGTDANSDYRSLRAEAIGSTCAGGAVNKTAYWIPSLMSGGRILDPELMFVYYKTGYNGQAGQSIALPPDGLKMIAGPIGVPDYAIRWSCDNSAASTTIPPCSGMLSATILFPQCWNGQDLDSPDHRSHMAYPDFDGRNDIGCYQATHPVLLPEITVNVEWAVERTDGLHLSNESANTAAPGSALHSDFFEAWTPQFKRAFMDNCIIARRDCGVNELGDGFSLITPSD